MSDSQPSTRGLRTYESDLRALKGKLALALARIEELELRESAMIKECRELEVRLENSVSYQAHQHTISRFQNHLAKTQGALDEIRALVGPLLRRLGIGSGGVTGGLYVLRTPNIGPSENTKFHGLLIDFHYEADGSVLANRSVISAAALTRATDPAGLVETHCRVMWGDIKAGIETPPPL